MVGEHTFGGAWTEQKLAKLKGYLEAYAKIFNRNPRAQYFDTYYVDAFAGTGSRSDTEANSKSDSLFPELNDPDVTKFRKGSARIALDINPGFKNFLFIEENQERVRELEKLKVDYPSKAAQIQIKQGEANNVLNRWCKSIDWKKTRAVVFLDPYGMQVEWSLLEAIAATKAIDLWLLFPLGTGVMRILTKKGQPPSEWSARLTKLFGNEEWKQRFYQTNMETDMFDGESKSYRAADCKQVASYLVERLATIFSEVQKTPYPLYNSKNCPLYLLVFAAGNKKGASTALRIANDLLKD
jgi:three-Cys-motif partner protein